MDEMSEVIMLYHSFPETMVSEKYTAIDALCYEDININIIISTDS